MEPFVGLGLIDAHIPLAPHVSFSRSRTQALPALMNGQRTDEVLRVRRVSAEEIAVLGTPGVVA